MRHKGGHSWGWEVWWGWVSKRKPFKVVLRGTHPMGPKSLGSRVSSYIENMHEKLRRWYTLWSGKVSKTLLISDLLGLGFAIPAALLAISLLGESAPLISCSIQIAICPEDEREEGNQWETSSRGWDTHRSLYFPIRKKNLPQAQPAPQKQKRAWSNPALLRPVPKKETGKMELRGTAIQKPAEL